MRVLLVITNIGSIIFLNTLLWSIDFVYDWIKSLGAFMFLSSVLSHDI